MRQHLRTFGRLIGFAILLGGGLSVAPSRLRAQDTTRVDTLPVVAVRDSALSLGQLIALNDSLARVEDSLQHRLDSLIAVAHERFAASYRRAFHPTAWYAGALAVGLAANIAVPIERDPGGYPDRWLSRDKWSHFQGGYFLTTGAERMGVPARWNFALTCGTAVGFEYTQAIGGGFVSWRDVVAGCTGSAVSLAATWIGRKVRREQGQ